MKLIVRLWHWSFILINTYNKDKSSMYWWAVYPLFLWIMYLVRTQNFPKTNISDPLIHTRMCAYQGVRNVSFSENFAYVLNEWPLMDYIIFPRFYKDVYGNSFLLSWIFLACRKLSFNLQSKGSLLNFASNVKEI